jgi:hypothetical protein
VSEITDDNSGAYAKILKKTRRLKKEGEEAKSGERVLKSRVIETSTLPKHYDSSCDDFVYEDEVGSVAGSEVQTTVLKEVVPPPLVGLTPLNYDESLMLKEAFFTNSLAEKAVRDEERRRVATRRAEYTNRGKGVSRVVELTTHLSAADKAKEVAAKAISALTDVETSGLSPDRRHSTPVGAVSDSVSAEATRRATVASLRPSLLQELSHTHSMVTSGYVDELDSEPLEDIEEGKGEAKQMVLRRNTLGSQPKASQERKVNELHQGKRGSVQYSSQTGEEESGGLRKSLTNTEGSSSKRALQQANYSPIGRRPQETSPASRRASQAMLEQNKPSPSQSAVRRSSAMTVLERSPVSSRRLSQAAGQEPQSGSRTPQKQDLPPKGQTSEIGGRRQTIAQENLSKAGSMQDSGRRPSQGTLKSNSSLGSEKALKETRSKTEADVEGSQEQSTTPSRASKEGRDEHQRLPERKRKSIFDPEKEPNKIYEVESQSSHSSDYLTEEEEVASLTKTRTSVPSTLAGVAKNETGSIRRNTAKEKLLTPYRERIQRTDDAKSKRNPVETKSQQVTQATEESARKLSQSGQGTLSRRNTLAATSSAKSDDLRRVSSLKVVEESKKVPTVRRGTVDASNLLTRGLKRQPKPDDMSPIQAIDYDSDHSQGSNELNQSLHSQKSIRSQRSGRVDPNKSIDSSSSKSPETLRRNTSIGSDSSEGQLNASASRKRHSVAVTNSAFGSSSFSGLKLLAEQAIRSKAESPTSSRDHSVELKTPPSRAGRNSVIVTHQVSSYDKTPHMYSAKSGRTVQGISNKPQQPRKAGRVKELTKEDMAAIVIQRYFRDFYEKRGLDANKANQTEENSVVRLEKMLALLVDDRVIKGLRLMGGFVEYLEERGLNSLKL